MYKIEKISSNKYAVKKVGAQRASKVFDNYADALKYCNEKNANSNNTVKKDDFTKEIKNKVKKSYKKNKSKTLILIILVIILLGVVYYYGVPYLNSFENNSNHSHGESENNNTSVIEGDIAIHFLELGNSNTGDSVYIKAGDNDILIDAGSKKSSAATIKSYIDKYCDDGKLEYVIATHRHEDHIAGFIGTSSIPGIFDAYEIDYLIDFPKVETSIKLYEEYLEKVAMLENNGTIHYNALQCYNETDGAKRTYELSQGIELEILYNYYYENPTSTENNNSVCLLINQGSNHYLFTGDLEAEGEKKLVEYNTLPKCKLYKAGHHGSKTSSSEELLSVIQPEIVCVCCCAGNDEYTSDKNNQFPTQDFINRVAPYTDKIYVTTLGDLDLLPEGEKYGSMNGNIVLTCNTDTGELIVQCSNNNTILKDTQWFNNNRTWPTK